LVCWLEIVIYMFQNFLVVICIFICGIVFSKLLTSTIQDLALFFGLIASLVTILAGFLAYKVYTQWKRPLTHGQLDKLSELILERHKSIALVKIRVFDITQGINDLKSNDLMREFGGFLYLDRALWSRGLVLVSGLDSKIDFKSITQDWLDSLFEFDLEILNDDCKLKENFEIFLNKYNRLDRLLFETQLKIKELMLHNSNSYI
jgi:hypothetical protein